MNRQLKDEPRTDFERVLVEDFKDGMVAYLREHPEDFGEALRLATGERLPFCWRAASVLETCMSDNDRRVRDWLGRLVAAVPGKTDGHQRELTKILLRMELDDEQEGTLFNLCIANWEDVSKQPSVRGTAFWFLLKMVEKYPDLGGEVRLLTRSAYTKSLSPGIRHSLLRRLAEVLPGGVADDGQDGKTG